MLRRFACLGLTALLAAALASGAAAQRRGFIIGVGLGPGLTTIGGDMKVGVTTDFRIGTMIGRSVQLYFANKMNVMDSETRDIETVGVTGIGVTYQMPSGVLINGLVGYFSWIGWEMTGSEAEGGIGIGAGVGYEFAEHWVVSPDGSYGQGDDWSVPNSYSKVNIFAVALTLSVLSF